MEAWHRLLCCGDNDESINDNSYLNNMNRDHMVNLINQLRWKNYQNYLNLSKVISKKQKQMDSLLETLLIQMDLWK